MLAAFLITFREVIEVSLIIATILGILVKLKQFKAIKTVWLATTLAADTSLIILTLGSFIGLKTQEIYAGKLEELINGILMFTSAIFITWAVFFLHKYFTRYKIGLLQKLKEAVEKEEQKGLFVLVFTAVLREGFEIVLFLSTIYFVNNPQRILTGFLFGIALALFVASGLFITTIKLPVYYAFRTTTILLILFAAGLLAKGVHEFAEVGLLPETGNLTFLFIPAKTTFAGDLLQAVFGLTQQMDLIQLGFYSCYVSLISWRILLRKT